MGKVRVSNGKDTLEIEGADLPAAVKDGYKPTERIIVANSKTKESFEIDPQDVESALGEGFSFSDIVKKAQAPPKDVMTLAKERAAVQTQYDATKDLSKNTGVKNAFEPQLAGVDEQLKAQGYDPDFAQDIVDLPEGEGFSAKESLPNLQKLKRENPGRYQQELSSIKSKGGIFNLVRNKSDIKNAGAVIQGLQGLEKQDYRKATKEGIDLIHANSDDVDEQNKLKKEWIAAKAFDYGTQPIAPDVQEQFSHLSPYQQRAMQFLKDTDNPTFEAYSRLLTPGFEDQWMGSNEASMRRGREMKEREAENIGMGLMQRGMEQQLIDFQNKAKASGLTPEEQQKADALLKDYQMLATDKQSQNERYPNMASMDADRLMQESMGANNSVAKKFALGVGANFDDAINWAGDLIQDRGVNGNLELLGDKELTASVQRYTPEKDKLIGSDVVAKFDEGLQKDIDAVKADTKLSDDQKRDQISKLIKDNPDKVSYAPNDKAGKTNFTAKAILNTVGDVGSDLVSQLAIASLGGAANSASKVKQLSSLFGSTFATAYNDYYNEALKQNMPNPTQYALLHTTIEAASELIHNDFEVAKKIAGKSGTLGKIMSKITKGEWDDIVKMGRFSKLKAAALQTGQTALSSARKETLEETAGQIGGNIADEQVFNKETGVGEGVKDTMITTFVGMLPLGLLSLPFNYQNINRTQKYAMYEAGNNPDKFLSQIQSDLANGAITPQEAQEQKDNIDKAVKAVQKSTAVRTDGTPMTDNEKTEYAFNQAVLDEIKEQAQSAPAAVKEELKEKQEKIEEEQTKLVRPKKKKSKPKEEVVEETVSEETKPEQPKPKLTDKDGNEFTLHQKEDENGDITLTVMDESGKFTTNNVKGDKSVGTLELYKDPDGYYPQLVTVNKELRRKGIATQLFDYAEKKLGLKIKPTTDLSDEGRAFMKTRPSQINTVEDLERELTNVVSNETAPNKEEEEKQKEETPQVPLNKEEKTGPPVEKKELSEKQDYAYKNSWRFYSQKYPEDTHEDFVNNSSEASRIIKGRRNIHKSNAPKVQSQITKAIPESKILKDGGNVYHTLSRIAQRNPEYRDIINRIAPKSDRKSLAVKTRVFNEAKEMSRAFYDPETDTIYFDGNFEGDPETVIHETIHAMTAAKVPKSIAGWDYTGQQYQEKLNQYAESHKGEAISDLINLYIGAVEGSGNAEKFFGKNGIANDGNKFLEESEDLLKYGFLNIHEFLAEAFSNPEFQAKLRNIPFKSNSIWDSFISFLQKLFGIKKDAVERILHKGTDLIGQQRPSEYKPKYGLPKLGEINTENNQRPENEDVTQYTPQSIIDKSRQFYEGDKLITRVANFLEPIIKANPNIRIDTEAKVKPGVLGYSYPDGRVELNFDQIQDYDTLYRTGLHELMHAATRHEINNNPAFRGELETVLSEIRDAMKLGENGNIISALVGAGVIDANKYGAANEHEMIAEVYTNQAFNDMLRNIEYKGDNLLHRIFLAIAKFFSEKYKQITGVKQDISADNIADYLMELTESVVNGRQKESKNQDALPLLAPTKTNDLLIKIAKKALDKISEADVRAKLKQIANLDDTTIDEIIAAAKGIQPATPSASRQLTPAEIGEMPEERKPKNLLRKKYERYFTSSKGLPKWMMSLKDKATGTLQLEVRRALRLVNETKAEAKKLGFVDWDLFDKAIREQYYASDLTALKALPPELQVLAVEMRNKIDGLSRDLIINNYVTPEQALNIEANIGEYMTRSYKAFNKKNWAKKVPKEVREDAFRFLVQDYFTQADPALTEDEAIDWARKKAQNKVEEIIAGIDDKYTPGKVAVNKGKDMGILKRREDIPKEIRDLLGEYTDPGVNFAMTIARIASLKSNAEYLTKLKDMGLGNIFFEEDNKPAEASVQIAAEGSETWSPLNGLYTTPEVKEIFKEAEADTNKLVKGYLKVVGAIRWGKTVGSVVTQVKNFESNLGFAVLNGHYRAGKAGQSFKYLVDKLFKGDKSEDALIEKVIKLGVIGQSVGIRELKNMFRKDNLDSIILDSSLNEKTGIRKLGKMTMKPIDYLNKIYATSDDFWKIYGFLNEAEALSQIKFKKSYKDLTEDEQNNIDTEASERVKNTYPTYDRVWEGARYVSKGIPIVGNFLSFQAESLRVLRNAISYAIKDIQNPETRAMGARRLAGIATYLTARSMILYGIAQLTGVGLAGLLGAGNDDDEDQRLKDINRYAAPFMRSSEKFVKDHGDGTYTVYDVGSLEPYGIVFKTMNAFTSGNKTVKEPGLGAAATELLGPFLEQEMVFGTAMEVYNNENQSGGRIYNPLDPFGEQSADATMHFIKKMNPSTIDYIKRLVGSEDKENELAALFGGRGYEVDVAKNFSFKLRAASDLFDANRDALNKIKYNPDSSPDDIADAEEKYQERQDRLVSELNEDYEAAIRLGAPVQKLDEILSKKKFFQGYNKKTKHQIKTGVIEENKNEPELKEWQP